MIKNLWLKLGRAGRIGAVVGAVGILPSATYAAVAFGGSKGLASRVDGPIVRWTATMVTFALIWLAILLAAAAAGGVLGASIGKLMPQREDVRS